MDADVIPRMVSFLFAMLISLTVHEYAHAAVAYWLGDDTASSEGRLSLNPIVHIDPLGTIILPIIGSLSGFALFGWAKPVPTNPVLYTRRFGGKRVTMTGGLVLVALAGPASNLLFAVVIAIGLRVAGMVFPPVEAQMPGYTLAMHTFIVNISLLLFNLIPLPPLDGSRLLYWLLPDSRKPIMDTLARNTPLVFLGFIVLMNTSLFGTLFGLPFNLLIGGLADVFGITTFFRYM